MADVADFGHAARLEPRRAVEFLRDKGYAISWNWQDVWERQHAVAFTVAKATSASVLETLRRGVDDALSQGWSERRFVRELEGKLRNAGWWGRQTRLGPDGKRVEVQLGSVRRLKTIYRTNMRTSWAAARYDEQRRTVEAMPYWEYVAIEDDRTRPSHAAMSGRVFRWDDPFWETFYPPNGWNCRCRVRSLSARQVERRGLQVYSSDSRLREMLQDIGLDGERRPGMAYHIEDPPHGAQMTLEPDPGWNHRPTPGLAAAVRQGESYLAAFQPRAGEMVLAERAALRRLVDEAGGAQGLMTPAGAAAYRQALLREIEERHGPPATARVVPDRPDNAGDVAAADRVREASRMLPASWVRRANMEEIRVRYNGQVYGGSYNPRERLLRVGGAPSVALHEYVHHVQSMAPHLDVYFYEFHRRRTRGVPVQELRDADGVGYGAEWTGRGAIYVDGYAGREAAPEDWRWYRGGTPAGQRDQAGRPVETMTRALQQILADVYGDDLLGRMYRSPILVQRRHSRALFDLAISLLLSGGHR